MAKGAGSRIACPRCGGKGYTLQGLRGDYAVECDRCRGSGYVVVAKAQ